MRDIDYGFPPGTIFAEALGIGGGGGGEFTECKTNDGLLVKKLGIWYNKKGLQAMIVTYTNGKDGPVIGTSYDSYKEITLEPEEVFTRASLWGDGRRQMSGHILLETSKGQKFDAGKDIKGQTEYPIKTGSGILAGICGRSSYDIDMLSLIFLRPYESFKIENMIFGDLPVNSNAPQTK